MTKPIEEQMFDQVESVDDSTLAPIPVEKQKPRMGDPEWNEYVLNQLTEKELVVDKKNPERRFPKVDGLRRISNKILGRVVRSESNVLMPATENNNMTVTVAHTLQIASSNDCEEDIVVTAVADASFHTLDEPFNKYLASNASTKAMGRAYRDALQLQVCVAEEVNSIKDLIREDPEDAQPITGVQKKGIESTCKKLGIDCKKFLKLGPFPFRDIDDVPVGTAKKMMSVLNSYQSGTEIPEEIKL